MGKQISIKAREALRHIRNVLMHSGKIPSVRELMNLMKYKSPRSALLLFEELALNGYLKRKPDGGYTVINDLETDSVRTVLVPLVGNVACGIPLLAEQNVEAMIPVSVALTKPGEKYFLLRASGNSMDKAGIDDGDLLLIKQQPAAENGQIIVALIDDEATAKEYFRRGNIVKLIPRSSDTSLQPIILQTDFLIQGVVEAVIPRTPDSNWN